MTFRTWKSKARGDRDFGGGWLSNKFKSILTSGFSVEGGELLHCLGGSVQRKWPRGASKGQIEDIISLVLVFSDKKQLKEGLILIYSSGVHSPSQWGSHSGRDKRQLVRLYMQSPVILAPGLQEVEFGGFQDQGQSELHSSTPSQNE